MSAQENQEYLFSNLSDKVRNLNQLLLQVGWENVDFDCSCFSEGIVPENDCLSKEQKKLLQSIIENIPEWKRLLSCKQHYTHDYCLDIHTLSVIKKIKEFEEYNELKDLEKLVLLYSALLHDIEKYENEVDPEHPARGAKKACSILYRLGFSENFINNVYLLIKHHQVLGLLAAGKIEVSSFELAEIFSDNKLLSLQVILSIADIKSVKKKELFFEENMDKKIKRIINKKEHDN